MKKLPRFFSFCAAILVTTGLSACGETSSKLAYKTDLPPPFSKFTTTNKPTKTLITPSGEIEVYDPTQDPVIREAFRTVYDWGTTNAASDEHIRPDFDMQAYYRLMESHIRDIQVLDLKRANCTDIIVPPEGATYQGHDESTCPLNWGKNLSKCEMKMMGFDATKKTEPSTLLERTYTSTQINNLDGKPVTVVRLQDVGPKSDRLPYQSFEDQLSSFFTAECRMYKP